MTGDRARGFGIYAAAVGLLAAGGFWWFQTAPTDQHDARTERWAATARRLLPDTPDQHEAGTVSLDAGEDHAVVIAAGPGSYLASVVCVGGSGSEVRVTLSTAVEFGQELPCAGEAEPAGFPMHLDGELRIGVQVAETGPVVFRYSMVRERA